MGRPHKKVYIRLEVQYETTAGPRAGHSIALLAAMFASSTDSRHGTAGNACPLAPAIPQTPLIP